MKAGDIVVGSIVKIDNHLYRIDEREQRGTGQFGKIMHFRIRELWTGQQIERNAKSDEDIEVVELERTEAEYLYNDGENYFFMNLSTYEQFQIPKSVVGGAGPFLKENINIHVEFYNNEPVKIDFPEIVEVKVTTAPPGIHERDSVMKTVTLENGMEILAPQFVREGDTIRINTHTNKYMEKVKKEEK